MLNLYATYRNLLRCRPLSYSDGWQRNATCHKNRAELNLCGMLCPSAYDNAVSVNTVVTVGQLTPIA